MNTRRINPKVELASGEYDRRKQNGLDPGIKFIARICGVPANALKNYRANYISRKKKP
jgi:hypothetical protein